MNPFHSLVTAKKKQLPHVISQSTNPINSADESIPVIHAGHQTAINFSYTFMHHPSYDTH